VSIRSLFKALGLSRNKGLRCLYYWVDQFFDPFRFIEAAGAMGWYLRDWWRYSRSPSAEKILVTNTFPQLHDRKAVTPFEPQYFYINNWAIRRIGSQKPSFHVDVASQVIFPSLLSASVPVVFIDYRPLCASLSGLTSISASILDLPLRENSIPSLSCLHVAEHVGLGRYGDPLDPFGTQKSARSLARVLAKGGNLYFAVPVGVPRLCFNAHRIHDPKAIRDYFSDLDLVEFSYVTDTGEFRELACLTDASRSNYGCGMFWFRKE